MSKYNFGTITVGESRIIKGETAKRVADAAYWWAARHGWMVQCEKLDRCRAKVWRLK